MVVGSCGIDVLFGVWGVLVMVWSWWGMATPPPPLPPFLAPFVNCQTLATPPPSKQLTQWGWWHHEADKQAHGCCQVNQCPGYQWTSLGARGWGHLPHHRHSAPLGCFSKAPKASGPSIPLCQTKRRWKSVMGWQSSVPKLQSRGWEQWHGWVQVTVVGLHDTTVSNNSATGLCFLPGPITLTFDADAMDHLCTFTPLKQVMAARTVVLCTLHVKGSPEPTAGGGAQMKWAGLMSLEGCGVGAMDDEEDTDVEWEAIGEICGWQCIPQYNGLPWRFLSCSSTSRTGWGLAWRC